MAKRRAKRVKKGLGRRLLGALIKENPRVLSVLDRHGVHFCSGCYLTLFSPVDKVAAYHAVPDLDGLLDDLRRVLER